jgi:hypothetical protein
MSVRVGPIVAFALGLSLVGVARAQAGVALLVHEAVGFEAETSSAGHAAIYLSNVCTDNGRLLRVCRPGEPGVVVGTYPAIL